MHKPLNQIGNSWGIILTKTLLEILEINPTLDEIDIIIEGNEIRLKKYKDEVK